MQKEGAARKAKRMEARLGVDRYWQFCRAFMVLCVVGFGEYNPQDERSQPQEKEESHPDDQADCDTVCFPQGRIHYSMTSFELKSTERDEGLRVDVFLARGPVSRARIHTLLAEGYVRCVDKNGIEESVRSRARRVKAKELFRVEVPSAKLYAGLEAENIPLRVLYEDDHLIVIDKPAGLVVHPAPGHGRGTLVNALLWHCGGVLSRLGGRPGIVHRLDKDTSGVMVAAKTDEAHEGLAEQFAAHGRDGRLCRRYLAVVRGRPEPPRGILNAPLRRGRRDRRKMTVQHGGRHALTRYTVQEVFNSKASLVQCTPETGRTHQLRVHLAYSGHPVLGDSLYGCPAPIGRQALHAAFLSFIHPYRGERLSFDLALDSPTSADIRALLRHLSPSV